MEYRLYHRVDNVWADVSAPSAQEACQKMGWLIGDCWVREHTHKVNEFGSCGGGWKNITPRLLK